LTNGLRVLVREDRAQPVVAIVTHVKAGYFDEPEPLIGISHVLEHMYFKGTERRGAGEIARETKAAGGFLNAGTIYDHTSYYTVLPSSALEQGLDIQSDALLNSEIDEDELRRELLVIIQEARRKLDTPGAVAQEALYETMFDVHRMRRWRIGTEDVLGRLGRREVWQYYRDLYRPSNVVLAVAGDVDAERVFGLVERYYGGMPSGEPVRDPGPEEPLRRGFRFREMSGDIVRTHIEWGWRTPGTLHPDTAALDLLAIILGQGRASSLYRDVREAGLVTTISAYNYTPRTLGVFGVGAELEAHDTAAALSAIARVIERKRGSGFGPVELARARNIVEARLVRRLETVEGQANLLAEWEALGDWRLFDDYVKRLFSVGPEELQAAARTYLEPDLGTVLVYRPATAASLAGVEEQLRTKLSAAGPTGKAEAEPVQDAAPQDRKPPRSLPAMAPSRIEDGVHFYDADGVTIVVKPRRSSALVSLAVCCRGGALHEIRTNAGITALTARSSIKGTRTRTAAGLAEETEALGGVIVPSVSADHFDWSLSLPSRHFARGIELLADAALAPVFPHEEVERERRNMLSDLERVRDDMVQYPTRLFLSAAFQGHAYGLELEDLATAVGGMSADELRDWHEREVVSGQPWVFVVGDVAPDEAAAHVALHVSGLRPQASGDGAMPAGWPERGRVREARRDKTQTALMLGFPGPSRLNAALYPLKLLANTISGLGGRLFEELRSRHSLAYSVSAYPLSRLQGGAFVAYIAMSPDREEEARKRLLEELGAITDTNLPEEEVRRAKRYTIGAWQIRRQTNGSQLTDLVRALLLGEGLERLRAFESRIEAVTPEAIRETAATYFDRRRLVEGIVRGSGGGR
jgi:zinc protease